MRYSKVNILKSCDNIAIVFLIWSFICILKSEYTNLDVRTGLELIAMASAFILARCIPYKTLVLYILSFAGFLQAIYVILQQFGISESNHVIFKMTGFMGNPGQLGGFQAVSLISWLLLYRRPAAKIQKITIIISASLILYSLLLSDSRAGFLSAIAGIATITHKYWGESIKAHKWTWKVLVCISCISIWLLYLYRPESVKARILIWKVCATMFLDKPLFGFGIYGFNFNYMLYQEKYLLIHPDSIFTHIATDVSYPYNEFIRVLIEQGIVGFTLLILLISMTLKGCHNKRLCALLITFLTFSMFSYPSYKFTLCIMLPLFLGLVQPIPLVRSKHTNFMISIFSVAIIISCYLGTLYHTRKFQQWISEAYNKTTDTIISKISSYFILNHNHLNTNSSYSTLAKHFPEILSEDTIPLIFPSSENWCIIGNHYLVKENYKIAEKYFTQASQMAPTYICPKYYLWETYLRQGNYENAARIADEILHMQVKVENTYTLRIRNTILEYTQNRHK